MGWNIKRLQRTRQTDPRNAGSDGRVHVTYVWSDEVYHRSDIADGTKRHDLRYLPDVAANSLSGILLPAALPSGCDSIRPQARGHNRSGRLAGFAQGRSNSGLRAGFDANGNMERFIERVQAVTADISARIGWSGEG